MLVARIGRTCLHSIIPIFLLSGSFTVAAAASCSPAPRPERDITANSFYTDAHHSIPDPVRHAQNVSSVKPLEDYGRQVVRMADEPENHSCAVAWLLAWAEADAMMGTMSSGQAYYEREWMLSELALGYAKVKDRATPDQAKTIEGWFNRLAAAVIAHVDAHKGKKNNHYYWAGLAVAASGRVTGNNEATEWGRQVFLYAMDQIEDDGSLPNEMDRAARATNYHLFAAEPLVMLGAILQTDSPKLAKLVSFCVRIIADQDIVAKRTGFAQEPVKPSSYAWLAVYAHRHHSPEVDALLQKLDHKTAVSRLGGQLTRPNPLEETHQPD
jgi:poly(beta-D-mannuronate) lyase